MGHKTYKQPSCGFEWRIDENIIFNYSFCIFWLIAKHNMKLHFPGNLTFIPIIFLSCGHKYYLFYSNKNRGSYFSQVSWGAVLIRGRFLFFWNMYDKRVLKNLVQYITDSIISILKVSGGVSKMVEIIKQ